MLADDLNFDDDELSAHITATAEAVHQSPRPWWHSDRQPSSGAIPLLTAPGEEAELDFPATLEYELDPVSLASGEPPSAAEVMPTDLDLEQFMADAAAAGLICRGTEQQKPGLFIALRLIDAYLLVTEEGTTGLRSLGRLAKLCRRACFTRAEAQPILKKLDAELTEIYWEHWHEVWDPRIEEENPVLDIPLEAMSTPPEW
jgi:hypothetical protein